MVLCMFLWKFCSSRPHTPPWRYSAKRAGGSFPCLLFPEKLDPGPYVLVDRATISAGTPGYAKREQKLNFQGGGSHRHTHSNMSIWQVPAWDAPGTSQDLTGVNHAALVGVRCSDGSCQPPPGFGVRWGWKKLDWTDDRPAFR